MTKEQIVLELEQITSAVEQATGLVSRWNGNVELIPQAGFKGLKMFQCDICLDLGLASQEVRWRTLIHEALHAVSAGYNPTDFDRYRGWEEGTVEQLQRILRPTILAGLGIQVDSSVFSVVEEDHIFNTYIEALEDIRHVMERDLLDFYIGLLKTPIKDRHASLVKTTFTLRSEERRAFLDVLSASNLVLTRKLR